MVCGSLEPAANEVRENVNAGETSPTQTSDAKEEQGPSPAKTKRSMTVSNDELARRRQEVKILKEQISGKRLLARVLSLPLFF